ncbi:MAG: hypothetical protein ACYTFG_20455, partial [Planctomycetota bacterium]
LRSRVRHSVLPHHRISRDGGRARGHISVLAIGRLLEVDGSATAEKKGLRGFGGVWVFTETGWI